MCGFVQKVSLSSRKTAYFVMAFIIFPLTIIYIRKEYYIDSSFSMFEPRLRNASSLKWKLTRENQTFRNNLELVKIYRSDPAYEVSNDTKILPPSARVFAKKIFKNKPFVLWSNDLHMTPIKDLSILLESFGLIIKNYNLDRSRCEFQDCSVANKVKILNTQNALEALPPVVEKFVKYYKNDSEMKSVDAVFCAHPAGLCEMYLQLNKSVLVLPSTRYNFGRFTAKRWMDLNVNLVKLSEKPWNVFGGNNLYDAKYMQYYIGVKIHHLPSMCDNSRAQYTNKLNKFLVLRRYDRGFNPQFFGNFTKACNEINCSVELNLIGSFPSHSTLAQYRGVIHVPYQVSVMTAFEMYRMNVPMFVPSPELLARWQVDYYFMTLRAHNANVNRKRVNASSIPPHYSQIGVPDPLDDFNYDKILYWFGLMDLYQIMPYGIIFESIPHLVSILENIDNDYLMEISRKMEKYNIEFKKALLNKWRDILLELAENSPNHPN